MPRSSVDAHPTHARLLAATGVLAALGVGAAAVAEVAVLDASLDATLYESATIPLANGAGEWFFAGRNNQGLRRRGLIAFDLAGFAASLGGAPIELHSARLELVLSQGGPDATTIHLHRVMTAWGEGTSDASGNEGAGAPATPGSATWLHAFYDVAFWNAPGGDFAAPTSATFEVGAMGALQVSSEGMRQDVLAWLADGSSNFGWILIGDESQNGTARRFDSRHHASPDGRPRLVLDYTVVPAPSAAILLASMIRTTRRRRA